MLPKRLISRSPLVLVLLLLVLGSEFGTLVKGVSFKEDVRISFQQKVAIDKLRRRVLPYITEDYMKEDIYLVRWLRVSEFDVSSAERRLIENIKWRKENKLLTIDQEDFSDVALDYPYSNTGYDKEGRPIFIVFLGEWDIRSAIITGRANRALRYVDKAFETLARRIRIYQHEGRNVTKAVLIIDAGQFNLVQHACLRCLMVIVEFLQSYESHFPGLADKIILVNAPPTINFVIDLAKQAMSKDMQTTLNVYGTNKNQWEEVLRKYIDRKYLPVELGGTDTRI